MLWNLKFGQILGLDSIMQSFKIGLFATLIEETLLQLMVRLRHPVPKNELILKFDFGRFVIVKVY